MLAYKTTCKSCLCSNGAILGLAFVFFGNAGGMLLLLNWCNYSDIKRIDNWNLEL